MSDDIALPPWATRASLMAFALLLALGWAISPHRLPPAPSFAPAYCLKASWVAGPDFAPCRDTDPPRMPL